MTESEIALASATPTCRPASVSWCDRHRRPLLTAMILLHAGLLTYAALSSSVTFDEYAHLPAGCAYGRHGDFSIYSLNPPLLRMWAAAAALVAGAEVPSTAPVEPLPPGAKHWEYAEHFLRANFDRYPLLFVHARLSLIPISCLCAWIVYSWAGALYGTRAGLAACLLYVLSPDILAHASLVTTDAGSATAMLAAAWLWWRFCLRPSWRRGVLAGLVVGLAHLCKFSALLLWPVMLLITWLVLTRSESLRWGRAGLGLLGAGGLTLLMINAVYGFQGSGAPLGSYRFASRSLGGLSGLPQALPVPLPRDFVEGFDAQKREAEGGYTGFVMGELYAGARWYYYPIALACKLPVAMLGLLGLSLLCAVQRIRPQMPGAIGTEAVLAAFLVLVFFLTALIQINIGVRYLLPVLPFGFILAGRLWCEPARTSKAARWRVGLATAMLCVLAVENASICPRYLSFVNAVAGGPAAGYRLVNDSNFDWGQSLLDLKRWMTENDVPGVQLAYFGSVDPGVYGIAYTPINSPGPEPLVAVSSYYLVGLSHRLPTPRGRTAFVQLAYYRELQRKRRVARIGHTIFVFRREDVAAAAAEFGERTGR